MATKKKATTPKFWIGWDANGEAWAYTHEPTWNEKEGVYGCPLEHLDTLDQECATRIGDARYPEDSCILDNLAMAGELWEIS